MRLEVLTDAAESGTTVHVLCRLSADAAPTAARPPINLALVIDRSSSMRGPRLAQAVRAANEVVDRLDQRDRLTVIVFDGTARLVFGPDPVAPGARDRLVRSLASLDTGVGTNLAAAIKMGGDKLRSGFVRGGPARLILLTDGQPSVGVTDPERLAELVAAEARGGITVTTMGVGDGFEDALLADLAERGRGGFYYLAGAADIPAAFGCELTGLFALAATEVALKLVPDEQVTSVDLLHRLPCQPTSDGLVVEIGDVAAGAPRQVLFRLTRDPSAPGRHLATLRLTHRGPDGKPGDSGAAIVGVDLPRLPLGPEAADVAIERLRLAVACAVDLAWARRASGDRDHALSELAQVKQQVNAAREQLGAAGPALDQLLVDLAAAENAVVRSAAERESIRRRMRERSQITLLGHSHLARLPLDDES